MNEKTLVKRVVKMIEKKDFHCALSCPKFKRYKNKNDYIKGEFVDNETCALCRDLFSNKDKFDICPCSSWESDLDLIRKQVYKVAKEVLGD